jgi:hypothetical protein
LHGLISHGFSSIIVRYLIIRYQSLRERQGSRAPGFEDDGLGRRVCGTRGLEGAGLEGARLIEGAGLEGARLIDGAGLESGGLGDLVRPDGRT